MAEASVTLGDLLPEVKDKNRNSTTGALDNVKRTRAINRVLQDLQDYADWEFTRRTKTFYFIDGVTEYSLENYVGCTAQDNDGATSVLDFKSPYDVRPINDADVSLSGPKDAKVVRENIRRNRFIKEYAVDEGILILGYPRQFGLQVHNCDSLTANGAWSISGGTNLTIDEVTYSEGNGALNFDLSAGTTITLTNSTLNAIDMEELQNVSQFTMDVWLPTITNFTSIRIRWGSTAAAYWEVTATVPAGNATLRTGKNKFAFRWASATQTGSPDVTAVDYFQILITYSGSTTATDFRIDDIRLGKEVEMELEYYSLAMVKDTGGDYQIEFNPDDVTQTDLLLGGNRARRCVVQGATYELFEIIGGKSERDRTDSYKIYEKLQMQLLKKCGRKIRRASRILNFPGRR